MAEPYLITPKHWLTGSLEPNYRLGLITSVESGGTPSTSEASYWDGTIPWLTPKEITGPNGKIYISKTERNITEKGLRNSSAKLMPSGTVMLTKRAPVGAAIVNTIPMTTNQGFLNFQCGSKLKPLYLAYWLRVNKPYLDLIANGSVYPELYKSDLFELQIAVPKVEEQEAILQVIGALEYAINLGTALEQTALAPERVTEIQEQSRRLSIIKEELLPALLSGDLSAGKLTDKARRKFEFPIA